MAASHHSPGHSDSLKYNIIRIPVVSQIRLDVVDEQTSSSPFGYYLINVHTCMFKVSLFNVHDNLIYALLLMQLLSFLGVITRQLAI